RLEHEVRVAGERGVHLGRAPAAILLGRDERDVDAGMARQETQQLGTDVAGGADHRDPDARLARHARHVYATRPARAMFSASSTADACAPCGARTSCARLRASRA